LVELVWADGPPSVALRRALSRQMGSLDLPKPTTRALRAALDRPGTPATLAATVKSREHRRFVLAQAILASLIDGRRSEAERRFLHQLAEAFGFTPTQVKILEVRLAAFYAEHREFVDTFTASEAGRSLADEVVDDLSRKVEQNLSKVMTELRQAGSLAELLAKAARGSALSGAERVQLRQGLVDLAKAVPSLAILAAPGGLLLLAALTKVLPFSILPSAWDEPPPRKSSLR
jgi:DnaJ-domain-containing protein 1